MDRSIPVVFLHAYPLNAELWKGQVEALRGRTTLAPHFPGFGGRAPGAADLEGFARAVLGDMDLAGISKAVFVGLSMGGYTAFRVHALAPERVAGLVLADTRAGADDEAGKAKRTAQIERARKEGLGWLADTMLPGLLGETTRRDRPDVVAHVASLVAKAQPEGVARALEAMRARPDSTPQLAGIRVPVLVLVGEEDTLTPVAEARKIAGGVSGARLVVLPKAGHLANLEVPESFNRELLAFLAE